MFDLAEAMVEHDSRAGIPEDLKAIVEWSSSPRRLRSPAGPARLRGELREPSTRSFLFATFS
jgi:hypothetical protein